MADYTGGAAILAALTPLNGTFGLDGNGDFVATGADPLGAKWVSGRDTGDADGNHRVVFNAGGNAASGSSGIMLRYEDNDNYLQLIFNPANANMSLFRRELGVMSALGSYTDAVYSASDDVILNVIATGSTIECYYGGTPRFSVTETFQQSSTISGIRIAVANHAFSFLKIPDDVASESLILGVNDYECWQCDANDEAMVSYNVNFTGSPSRIERNINLAGWTVAEATPAGGVFIDSFTLTSGHHNVEYRFSNNTTITAMVGNITVGDGFLCCGQSQISGNPEAVLQTFADSAAGNTAVMLGNDDVFKQLIDPYDDTTNQVDEVSDEVVRLGAGARGGTWIPRFANMCLQSRERPIFFIPCALGGSDVDQWQKTSIDRVSGVNLYESAIRRFNLVHGIKYVFWMQGESDVTQMTAIATFKTKTSQLIDDFKADTGVNTILIPLGEITSASYDTTQLSAIKVAQAEIGAINVNATITGDFDGIPVSATDGVHFVTTESLDSVGRVVFAEYANLTGLIASTLNITATGTPDGTYKTIITNPADDTIVFAGNLVYTSGVASTAISIVAGSQLTGYVIDNEATHINGAVITGTTV